MDNTFISTESKQFELMFRRLLSTVHTSIPGVIVSFDGKTATVQPSVMMQSVVDGLASFIQYPPIQNVPVVIPFSLSAGLAQTMPILPGDQCMLLYAERAIDNVVAHGGVQPPLITSNQATAQGRTHDITDAVCLPGLLTLAHTIPNYSQTAMEIRDITRSTFISVSKGKIDAQSAGATISMSGGKVTATAPIEADITAPIIRATGNMTVVGTLTVTGIITGTGSTRGAL